MPRIKHSSSPLTWSLYGRYLPVACRSGMARFPSVFEPAAVTLSVVVPAYNEEERMPVGVDEMIAHLKTLEAKPFW